MSETTVNDTPSAASSCCGPAKPVTENVFQRAVRVVRSQMAWTVTGLGFLTLAILDTPQAPESLIFVGNNLLEIAPFLALAIGIAAFAKASDADSLIAKVFSGRLAVMIFAAALFGAVSPFCSCGVIPLIAALLAMGVPLSAVMAFWLASPVMDPSMFVLTTGTLGAEFATAKLAAAIGIGMAGGYTIWALEARGWLNNPLREGVGGGCGSGAVTNPNQVTWKFWQEEARVKTFGSEALANTLFLGKWLIIAFFLESLMVTYVPADLVARVLGADSSMAIPLAALVGVPAYLNGYAALPLVSGMIDMGVSPGAGMAFMVSGGMTCIPAAIAVFALVKKPVFALYVSFALFGGVAAGVGYQLFI